MKDRSRSRHRRRSKKQPLPHSSDLGQRSRSKSGPVTTCSFAPPPPPSRSTIRFSGHKKEQPVYKGFLAAFLGVFLIVLLGGSYNAAALGMALILPGLFLLCHPPSIGLGKLGDMGVLGLLGSLLLAFLPQFYWPTAGWRTEAISSLDMELPAVLSVQPWISFETWVMAAAGFAWFYAALQLKINLPGRRRLFFWLSILLAGFAGAVIWGNLSGALHSGAEDATAFSLFSNRNLTTGFLALGGVATFAYAMEAVRTRALKPLVGVPASVLCLLGLVFSVSRAGVLLYLIGVGLWFLLSLRARSLPRVLKVGFPLVIVAFSLVVTRNEQMVDRMIDFATSGSEVRDDFRLKMYKDTADMVMDAPLSGFGLGNFSAVFPQYRKASADYEPVVHPESDILWLAAEGGLLAVAFFGVFLYAYARLCRGFTQGASAGLRILAFVVVSLFLLHGWVDVPGHQPGTVYFAILFAVLALPKRGLATGSLPPRIWRILGGSLLAIGFVWFAAGVFRQPWHSSIRIPQDEAALHAHIDAVDFEQARAVVDHWIAIRPLDWRAYFQRAQLTLVASGDRDKAAADFRRARFAEPILGEVSFEEGKVWLPYDTARAIAAWRLALFRELNDKDGYFGQMLNFAKSSPDAMERMARLSELDPHYRTYFLCHIAGERFLRELRIELARDPSLFRFNREQRTKIVRNWIQIGDLDSVAGFLTDYGGSLNDLWWLWSLVEKDRVDFKEAVEIIRQHLEVPEIPAVQLDETTLSRLMREYAVASEDIMKGTALLYVYTQQGAYEKALPIVDRLLYTDQPPLHVYYWRAECLYQLEEYIESWYAFEAYLGKLWETK